ncbi:MAG: hypothetical protein V4736_14195 [Bdellovibrionota bacterium]
MPVKVAVLNAFGRGDSLAVGLAKNQFDVHHFDFTSQLGNWSLEDIQGPFGYLRHDPMDQLLIEQFHYSDPIHYLPRGFCFWGSKGPMEAKNPLFLEWMGKTTEKSFIGREELRDNYPAMWPLLLLTTWHSVYEWNWKETSFPNNFKKWAAEFGFFHPTRKGWDRRIDWFIESGVTDYRSFQLLDFATEGKNILSLELEGPERGLMGFDEVIWCLSVEQAKYLNSDLATKLFSKGTPEPDSCWIRYRIEMEESEELRYRPRHMLMVRDEFDHWSQGNFLIVQRTPLQGFWDVWCKVPQHQRFSKNYITEIQQQIMEHIHRKLPSTKVLTVILPPESQYSFQELGPSPYGTFKNANNIKSPWSNLHFHGPESRYSFGLNDLHEQNGLLIKKLVSRREERIRKERPTKQ